MDRNQQKIFLDRSASTIADSLSDRSEDDLLIFYKKDKNLNEVEFNKTAIEHRYKLFTTYKNSNFIRSYNYRFGKHFDSDWGLNFEK